MARAACQTDRGTGDLPAVDLAAALVRLGGDQKLLDDVIGFFFEDAFKLLAEIHSSVATCDWPAARRAAHSLKGLAANFSAAPTVAALQFVEEYDGAPHVDVTALVRDIDREMSRLAAALTEFSENKPTAR